MQKLKTFFGLLTKPQSIVTLLVGLFLALTTGFYFLSAANKAATKEVTPSLEPTYLDQIEPEVEVGEENADQFSPFKVAEDGNFSVVLVGYGGANHAGGTLADTIILLSLNPATKSAKLISIPRDLWVALPTDFNNQTFNKLNSAFAIGLDNVNYPNKRPEFRGEKGGGELVKYGVYSVTGIQVDHFVSVDFSSFSKAIDELGGITVNVPRTFDDYFYPVKGLENETCGFTNEEIAGFHASYTGFNLEKQFACRYEHIHYDQGSNQMTGSEALKFVRSRHSATYGGDFARSERQFAVLMGVKEKVLAFDILGNKGALFNMLVSLVSTDIAVKDIDELISPLGNILDYKLAEIILSTDNVLVSGKGPQGQFILIPKLGSGRWSEVVEYIESITP